tara:strand:- start:475 stop:756 length:282 start_codon:yes stop_codon:yes gene_type:complete
MKRNLGTAHFSKKTLIGDRMEEFDRLPPYLRRWLRDAHLPWSPTSVKRVYFKALKSTGDYSTALAELDVMQSDQLTKEQLYGRRSSARKNFKP